MKVAFILILGIVFASSAKADCYYDGKRYSDGATRDGQVCDGRNETWK